jgi:carbonic anhydrase/acetyltransferase-like protein (isoleucine patch superfamily)
MKLWVYEAYEKLLFHVVGPGCRSFGQSIYNAGRKFTPGVGSEDVLVPSLRRKLYKGNLPALENTDFIAPNATVIGNVEVGESTSIWYGTTLRGDLNKIKVGKNAVLQDLAMLYPNLEKGIKLGDNVLVGPNSVLESVTLENNSFVGMGASVRKGAKIESYGLVAAGAVIPEDTTVPAYQIWAGNPAKYLRDLTNEEKEVLDEHHQELQQLAKVHAEECEKSTRQIMDDRDELHREIFYDEEDFIIQKMRELGFPIEEGDDEFLEQRIHHKEPTDTETEWWNKRYDPYETDLYHYPDSFKIYGENFKRYEEVKKFFDENPYAVGQTVERQETIRPTDKEPWQRKF